MNKRCPLCKTKYNDEKQHYCKKCGKNLTEEIEKSDLFYAFYKICLVLGILGFVLFTIPMYQMNGFSLDGTVLKLSCLDYVIMLIPIILIIIAILLRIKSKKLCLKNIQK